MDEGEHVGGMIHSLNVFVSPFDGVAEKGGVPERRGSLPVPLSWVPWEVLDKPRFIDLEEGGFLTSCRRVPGDLEGQSGSFL